MYYSGIFSVFKMWYSHYHYLIQNIFITPARNGIPVSHRSPFPPTLPLASTDLFSASLDMPTSTLRLSGVLQYVVFCDHLLLLQVFPGLLRVVAGDSTSFLSMAKSHSVAGRTTFCYPPISGGTFRLFPRLGSYE